MLNSPHYAVCLDIHIMQTMQISQPFQQTFNCFFFPITWLVIQCHLSFLIASTKASILCPLDKTLIKMREQFSHCNTDGRCTVAFGEHGTYQSQSFVLTSSLPQLQANCFCLKGMKPVSSPIIMRENIVEPKLIANFHQ